MEEVHSYLMRKMHFSIKNMYYNGQNKRRRRDMFQAIRLKGNSNLRNASKITSGKHKVHTGEVLFGGERMVY